METHNHKILSHNILSLSVSEDWDKAKLEWEELERFEDHDGTCLCSHHPITEHCVLQNQLNKHITVVGNCCVKKFFGISDDNYYQNIRKITKDPTKSLNQKTLDRMYRQGWLSDWEFSFYSDINAKRKLSSKQLDRKLALNKKITQALQAQRLRRNGGTEERLLGLGLKLRCA